MTETKSATERLLIVDGHVRPAPLIETGQDEHGRTIITREEHYAPQPVHFAVDPDTGIVYAGPAPHIALGVDPPAEDVSQVDAAREFEEFRAWKASNASATVSTPVSTPDGEGEPSQSFPGA